MSKEQIKKIINNFKDNFKDRIKLFDIVLYIKLMMFKSPEEAINTYFEAGGSWFENSVVLKQIKKLSSSFTDLKQIKKMVTDYLTYILNQHKDEYKDIDFINKQRHIFYFSIFKNNIDDIFELLQDKNKVNALIKGFVMDMEEMSIFMDIYYIFRTFKIPDKNKNPFLSILYAGNFHTRNISYFLTDIIKYYDIVSDTKIKDLQDSEFRCTYIPNINFNDLAFEYGVEINKNSTSSYSPFLRIKVNRRSRLKSRSRGKSSRGTIAVKSNPKLWERIKNRIKAGSKGGPKGKWSARKSQLLVKAYKSAGGKFKGKKSRNNSLSKWSREKWDYINKSGRKSKRGRYLPEKVRKSLTPRERKIENRRKGSKRGKWVSYSKSVAKKMRKHKI